MRIHKAPITEIRLRHGQLSAWIDCPENMRPAPGQYVLAYALDDRDEPLASPLFPAEIAPQGFLSAPPIPDTWEPGMTLQLRGPLGNGFNPPAALHHLALVALGDTTARLMPLIQPDLEVTLVTDLHEGQLSSALEIMPVSSLIEVLQWADFAAFDLPLSCLADFRQVLPPGMPLPCPAQALVTMPMPCAGLAACGVCAVPARRGYRLACLDGPVFNLAELDW